MIEADLSPGTQQDGGEVGLQVVLGVDQQCEVASWCGSRTHMGAFATDRFRAQLFCSHSTVRDLQSHNLALASWLTADMINLSWGWILKQGTDPASVIGESMS